MRILLPRVVKCLIFTVLLDFLTILSKEKFTMIGSTYWNKSFNDASSDRSRKSDVLSIASALSRKMPDMTLSIDPAPTNDVRPKFDETYHHTLDSIDINKVDMPRYTRKHSSVLLFPEKVRYICMRCLLFCFFFFTCLQECLWVHRLNERIVDKCYSQPHQETKSGFCLHGLRNHYPDHLPFHIVSFLFSKWVSHGS
jgi:hypothetical protein